MATGTVGEGVGTVVASGVNDGDARGDIGGGGDDRLTAVCAGVAIGVTVTYGVASGTGGESVGTGVAGGVCKVGVGGNVNPGGPKSLSLLVGAGV